MFKPLSIEALASQALQALPWEVLRALPVPPLPSLSFNTFRPLFTNMSEHIVEAALHFSAFVILWLLQMTRVQLLQKYAMEEARVPQWIWELYSSIQIICQSYLVQVASHTQRFYFFYWVAIFPSNPGCLMDDVALQMLLSLSPLLGRSWAVWCTMTACVLCRMILFGALPSEVAFGVANPAINPWLHRERRDAVLFPVIALFWLSSNYKLDTNSSSWNFAGCILVWLVTWISPPADLPLWMLLPNNRKTNVSLLRHSPKMIFFRAEAVRELYLRRLRAFVADLFAWKDDHAISRITRYKELTPFEYTSIATELETRVLRIHRRVGFRPPRCQLVRINFEDACEYDVCSFAQDDEEECNRLIIVNNQSLLVSEATYRVLRRRESFFQESTVWIRCICVNESDDEERTAQVRNIGGIFRNARRIDAYVDDSSWSPPLTFFLRVLRDRSQHRNLDLLLPSWNPHWQRLARFLNQPWFQRTWAFKEVATAGQLSLINGGESISWSLLASAMNSLHAEKTLWARLLSELELQIQSEEDPLSPDQVASQTTTMNTIRVGYLLYGQISLLNLLKAGGGSRSADPRDRIFALIGLAPAGTRQQIEIDYSRETVEIFTQVMAHIMEEERDSQILAHSGLRSSSLGVQLPSWVSAWTDAEADVLADHTTGRWSAARRHTFYKDMSFSSGGVLVGLKRVGRVIELGQVWPSVSFDEADLIQRERQFLRASWWLASKYYDPTWQTMDDIVCHDLNCVLLMIANSQMDDIIWTNGDGGWEEPDREGDEENKLEEEVRHNMMGKRLAVIAPDRLAAVPEVTESSDEVHLLAGARTPFVMRRVEGSGPNIYELVGPCYVIGVMGGELDTSQSNREKDGVRWQMSYIV